MIFISFLMFAGVITLALTSVNAVWCLLLEESPVLKVQKEFIVPISSLRMDLCVLVFWLHGKEVVWHMEFLGRDAFLWFKYKI